MKKNTDVRFAYFGTPSVARDTFDFLLSRDYAPALVVSSPDAPKGRGLSFSSSETKQWAEAHDFPVVTPEKIDPGAIEKIRSYECGLAIVVAYGKLFPKELLDAFPLGVFNIHYSLLPKYRGASPVESALLNGEEMTGVTIQRMVLGLDAGDIVAQKRVPILPEETARELRPRLIKIGAELLADMLPSLISGAAHAIPQDATQATFSKKVSKAEGELNLSGDPTENWNKYRAFAESPGTFFFIEKNGKKNRIKIASAEFVSGEFRVLRVVPEGKQEMAYADFVRNL